MTGSESRSQRPRKKTKRYGRRRALESVSGTYTTVMPCRDCGALVVYREVLAHERFHDRLGILIALADETLRKGSINAT